MKNIQVIDGARNCTYSVYSTSDSDFEVIFPDGQDIEFYDDLDARVNQDTLLSILTELWEHEVDKKEVQGIHGTLFYELEEKKILYPTKKENEMISGIELLNITSEDRE